MPVYNAGRYVAEAVQSILQQTISDFELVIINDGSTDDTLRIVQRCAESDGRIRLISRENRGLVASLNEGVERAGGRFIARMDGDDWSHPRRLERQAAFLRAEPDYGAVGCRVLLMDSDGEPVRHIANVCSHEQIDEAHLNGIGGTIAHPAVMMRREAIETAGGYRSSFELAEDLDLFLRIGEHWRLANLPEVLLHYRLHMSSAGTTGCVEQARSVVRAVEEACQRRRVPLPREIYEKVNGARQNAETPVRHRRNWAWWALKEGHVRTARKHALAAIREDPLSADSWRLMYCALRGR